MSETHPPESGHGDSERLPFAEEPPESPKKELDWPFALLGFFTPWIATVAIGYASELLAEALEHHPRILSMSPPALEFAVFAVLLAAFVWGRSHGDNRLRSFGLGGLVSYVVTILVGLLAFGACMVVLSGFNPSGG